MASLPVQRVESDELDTQRVLEDTQEIVRSDLRRSKREREEHRSVPMPIRSKHRP